MFCIKRLRMNQCTGGILKSQKHLMGNRENPLVLWKAIQAVLDGSPGNVFAVKTEVLLACADVTDRFVGVLCQQDLCVIQGLLVIFKGPLNVVGNSQKLQILQIVVRRLVEHRDAALKIVLLQAPFQDFSVVGMAHGARAAQRGAHA